jgi:hypothetical protein
VNWKIFPKDSQLKDLHWIYVVVCSCFPCRWEEGHWWYLFWWSRPTITWRIFQICWGRYIVFVLFAVVQFLYYSSVCHIAFWFLSINLRMVVGGINQKFLVRVGLLEKAITSTVAHRSHLGFGFHQLSQEHLTD